MKPFPTDWREQLLALMNTDIRDFGCRVERDRDHPDRIINIYEPLSYKAPSIAKPYCCYICTVIFYVSPYEVTRNGNFREWGRVDSMMRWDCRIRFEDQIYETGGGTVIRLEKAWWMKRWAKLWRPDAAPKLACYASLGETVNAEAGNVAN